MEASPPRSATLDDLSGFLLAHESHAPGFDINHPAGVGGGRVMIVCRGCGARHEHATATLEFEPDARIGNGVPAPPRTAPGAEAPRLGRSAPVREADRGYGAASGRSLGPLTAGLLALALIALVFAGIRLIGGGADDSGASGPVAGPAAGAHADRGAKTGKPSAPPAAPAPPAPPAPTPRGNEQASTRVQDVTTPDFRLKVPVSWVRLPSSSGLLLGRPGGRGATLRIFSDPSSGLGFDQMVAQSTAYLQSSGAGTLAAPRALRIGGKRAFEIVATSPGERSVLTGILSGAGRYLLVSKQRRTAPGSTAAELDAARRSFRGR